MVRRRSTKTNKAKANSKPRGVNRSEGKINKWNRAEDIPLDEEDEFHASRDRILLEGEEGGSDDYGEEEEVFALKGMPDSDEDEDEDEDEEAGEEGFDDDQEPPSKKAKAQPKSSKKSKSKKQAQSDSASSESEEEEESWGTKKSAYYSSNAAQLDEEDDEANDMEEQEAKRLQAKMRDALADDDFGLADAVEVIPNQDDIMLDLTEAPAAPVAPALPSDKKAIVHHLEKTSPETLALARDWEDVVENLKKTHKRVEQLEADTNDQVLLGMAHLHYQALLTYATTLAFYLHLRASEKYVAKPELLRTHPILPRLLSLKHSLSTLEDLDFNASGSGESDSDDLDASESDLDDLDLAQDAGALWKAEKEKRGELAELMTDAQYKALMAAYDARQAELAQKQQEEQDAARPKKKRKTKAGGQAQPIFDLQEPDLDSFDAPSAKGSRNRAASDADDVYGEQAVLGHADAADKKARKRSLQFYTTKVESSAARRQGARAALGGDDDVPYRERKKQKEQRLVEEAKKRGRQGGDDLDDAEAEAEAGKRGRDKVGEGEGDDGEVEGDNGYYSLVKQKKRERKEQKKTEYEAMKAASRPDYDEDAAEGPRALTRAILKNKGLTPHRSKSVRNPRVKKRQKYEKAKKKIASQKPIYKTGAGDAGKYEGEKSGISKVVKSVRL
ncbi:hypothetical protein GLOTRDRAFT_81585 [Gloeophyllum trabeum ATCC 11539]|uniref:Sas10 C-terminal domain-containing protein n=1 Tax=Gloeophyllum trabeum (strain ATCC 11539 / FP-39264 / Madison 617) TaxID=670483 RepID=S7REW6_GLOTA|nr:uncharacterized protein GLOTRDRAFT_81585 [Gloeophyllum trabeum ATCC 11539]EPQ50999.1 hypothetical protein GLOTRDRAFT_81585 [Gloeophyllum trabeum ATCC 11539]